LRLGQRQWGQPLIHMQRALGGVGVIKGYVGRSPGMHL
jgi:hypothetical protein